VSGATVALLCVTRLPLGPKRHADSESEAELMPLALFIIAVLVGAIPAELCAWPEPRSGKLRQLQAV
jgi:hypothetical protein